MTTEIIKHNYENMARDLADALIRYARDRKLDDKKTIADLQGELCKLRRAELALEAKLPPANDSQ